jgi:Ca-activated chloride channel family protein
MRFAWTAALVTAIVGATLAASQTFQAEVRDVAVYATVMDGGGGLVAGLRQDDFRVFDEGRTVALDLFDAAPRPMDLMVLLDISQSMTGSLEDLRRGAGVLINRLGPGDRARIAAFSNVMMLGPAFSAEPQELIPQLPRTIGANMTRLYDALVEALGEFEGADPRRRRVIVVFSDGADTASSLDRSAVTTRARQADTMIYAVGLTARYVEGGRPVVRPPDVDLRQIAEETGGGYVEAAGRDLSRGFERVLDELHRQYLLGFRAATDGRVHPLRVQVLRAGCTVHSRRSYLATKVAGVH